MVTQIVERDMATMHMAKGLAQNLVYFVRLLKAHPQGLLARIRQSRLYALGRFYMFVH